MKEHYLLCCALLLSAPYVQYSCAMQDQYNMPTYQVNQIGRCILCRENMSSDSDDQICTRLVCNHKFHTDCILTWSTQNSRCPECQQLIEQAPDFAGMQRQRDLIEELRNPATVQVVHQEASALDKECPICFEVMEFGDQSNPRVRLTCNHKFHRSCIEAARRSDQNCPACRQPIDYQDDFPDLASAIKAQPDEPMQMVQRAQSTRAVEPLQLVRQAQPANNRVEADQQRVQLTQRQRELLEELINESLGHVRPDVVQVMFNAFTNPLVLANGDVMAALITAKQRELAQEFVDLALDAQVEQQPTRVALPAIDNQERLLIEQLANELQYSSSDEVKIALMEAYTNPYVLVQNPVFTAALNNDQKALVDLLLSRYTQRITQQN